MDFPSIIGRAVILYCGILWSSLAWSNIILRTSSRNNHVAKPSHVLCFRWNRFLNSQQLKPFFVTHRETTGLPRARQQPSMQPSHHPWKIGRATLVVCRKCHFFAHRNILCSISQALSLALDDSFCKRSPQAELAGGGKPGGWPQQLQRLCGCEPTGFG